MEEKLQRNLMIKGFTGLLTNNRFLFLLHFLSPVCAQYSYQLNLGQVINS